MVVNANITDKKYKKLTLQVTLNGFAFCVIDTLNQAVISVKEIDFSKYPKANKVEDYYWKAFTDNSKLKDSYDEVIVLHDSNLDTFVPTALFDEDFLGSYLQYNTKVFETDFFAFDALSNYEINHVYIPFVNINNYLLDQFVTFNYKHTNSILVSKLLELSKNVDEKEVFVHFSANKFEIIIVQNQKLLLFNSFNFVTKEDFIYYLLFATEQLNLNPENFKVSLLGKISEESELFQIAFKYVRNVSLLDVSDLQKRNDFSTSQNLKHFILFQS
ncbi:MAG: DUF3822 family protein [Flavobacteriaceae bacterium]|nr:DUF3822 family protein [Flavobacteriaceae bacterium]